MRWLEAMALTAAIFALTGCGPSVGDACTTAADCGNQLCLNQLYLPGGYCSKPCSPSDQYSCPSGSTCIANGNGPNNPACFRVCSSNSDCRGGYQCKERSSKMICAGAGF